MQLQNNIATPLYMMPVTILYCDMQYRHNIQHNNNFYSDTILCNILLLVPGAHEEKERRKIK